MSIADFAAHSPGTALNTSAMVLENCIGSADSSRLRTDSTALRALSASSL